MKWLVRLIGAAVLLVAVISIAALVMMLEPEPRVQQNSARQVDGADAVAALLPQMQRASWLSHRTQVLRITAQQLDSLAGLAQRARPELHGQANIAGNVAVLAASYKLPFGDYYLNLSTQWFAGNGVQLGAVQIGRIQLPGQMVVSVFSWLLDRKLGASLVTEFLQRVQQVSISEQAITVTLAPFDDLLEQLKSLPPQPLSSQDLALQLGVQYYLQVLANQPPPQMQGASLLYYLRPLFASSQARSSGADAVQENKAALLALAIFSGNHHFARFVDLQASEVPRSDVSLTLAGRGDLHLHFVYSMAIKLLSDQGISFAIGEFKELMDRADGGSGYSFVDLAADMAGIRLAQWAMNPVKARRVQQMLAQADDEGVFFPDVLDLPEGLDKGQFLSRFDTVDSPQYRRMVAQIEQRLQRLPLYQ